MNVVSLDSICRNILMKRGYSIHYYIRFLVYLKEGLRNISFDDVQTIRYKVLTLNDNNAIEIPDDYVDYCRVSVRIDQYLHPLVEDINNSLDLVPNYDSNFQIQPYINGVATDNQAADFPSFGYASPYWWMTNWNSLGENTGRMFGGTGSRFDNFRVNKARNEIKINERLNYTEYVLEYISNGQDADSATHIDGYAQDCLQAFAMWQFKENNRTYTDAEAERAFQKYTQQRDIFRARISDLTINNLKRIVQRSAIGVKY